MSDVQGAQEISAAENDAPQAGEFETAARGMGWRPKEEFKGDASKWVDAEQFVNDRDVSKLRRTVREMTDKFGKVEGELKETKQVLSDFRDFASRGEQRAYERALAELKAKRDVAVASADTAAFNAVEAEIDKLNKDTKPQTTAKTAEIETETRKPIPPPDPAISKWMGDNPWFNSDDMLHGVAGGIDTALMKAHPGMPVSERLEMVTAEVKRRFPEKFANQRRDQPGAVLNSNNGGSPPRKRGKTYDDLPAEAKKACDKFVKTMPPDRNGKKFTREEYVASYDWSDA